MVDIPRTFARWIETAYGAPGAAWLADLPGIVEQACNRWQLAPDGEPMHGGGGIALPVRQRTEPLVLKLSFNRSATRHEARALTHWAGRGMVRLQASDAATGALLLERLGPETLLDIGWRDGMIAAADLIRQAAVPGTTGIPTVRTTAEEIAASLASRYRRYGAGIPRSLVERVPGILDEISADPARRMVNKDVHFANVLRGTRQPWLAIDPMPLLGAPEFGAAPLFWRLVDRLEAAADLREAFDLIAMHASLDAGKLRRWTLVRVIDYWLWAVEHGLTRDPVRCRTVLEWLEY